MGYEHLIDQYIEPSPHKRGPAEAWLKNSGVSVWAIVAYLKANNWNLAHVAHLYDVPIEEVEAVAAYYQLHKCAIDARLDANRATVS